ncbi:MAG TPA: ATP-binding protein, partial [Desulfitobacteriaceae bacterium]|nr:ATP-binding protein [Desulfitobacteriaceae bacterium]
LEPVLKKITIYTNDLKKMNLQLDLSRSRINKILEGISDGFYMLDDNWQFEFVNNSTMKLMCPENDKVLGKNIWEVLPGLRNTLTWNKMQQAFDSKEYVQWEAEGFADSSKTYEYRAYPLKDGLTIFFRDITEFKQQKQEYARLERLSLVGQLAAGISHEIRNPMTTIRGFLQIFGEKSRYKQDKNNIDLMISEIDRANEIITDFLSLAKANLNNDKSRNINEIIEKILPMLQADAYDKNKEVVADLTSVPDILINENEIIQLVLNLVRNGLDASPENNEVTISTYLAEDKVVLAIQDQGSGIAEEHRDKIGTPFFSTKETGTGLGLATSMSIAQRHKALFKFETSKEGTVFYTIFPVCSE